MGHLHATGVGKTVNSLRKIQARKDVNVAAKALVAKWKNMVIEEDNEEKEKEKSQEQDAKRLKLLRHGKDDESKEMSYRPSGSAVPAAPHEEYSPAKTSQGSDEYNPEPVSNGIKVLCYSPSKKVDEKKKTDQDKNYRKSDSEKTSHHSKKERSKSSSKSSSSKKPENGFDFNSGKNAQRFLPKIYILYILGATFEEALGCTPVKKSSASTSRNNHVKQSPSKAKISTDVPAKKLLVS